MRRHHTLILFVFCLVSLSAQAQWQVLFSANGGFYEETFELELFSTHPQGRIFYTTNGNRPTVQSQQYTEPLVLDERMYSESDIYTIVNTVPSQFYLPDSIQHCIVIRAAVFDDRDSCISPVTTQSYFIHALGCDTHGLPAVSICADSLDLFDYMRGIFVPGVYFDTLNPYWSGNYYLSGREWERPMNIEFYEIDNTGINQQAGVRTHGGNGRRFQQKSIKIYAREEYGKKRFKHKFFETIPQDSFKHLVLKPFMASWNQSGVNDHICSQIAYQLNLETLATRPVLLYLNGEYWGIYYIHERPDERYLEDHLGIDINHVNIMSNWVELADYGTAENFINLYQWLETADLTQPDDYAYFASRVDIDNFIDYQIFEIFIENCDWPANNMRCWQLGDGLWRWIFYDGDGCLLWMTLYTIENAVYEGENTWPSSARATLFLRKLLENDAFKTRFEDRFDELVNTAFSYDVTSPIFENIKMRIEPEIPQQSERFGFPQNMETWVSDMDLVDYFLRTRPRYIVEPLHDLIVRVPENHKETFTVYPNPSSEEIHFKWQPKEEKMVEIAIFDILGRKVFSKTVADNVGETTLNPILQAGVYLLKIGSHTEKIIRY